MFFLRGHIKEGLVITLTRDHGMLHKTVHIEYFTKIVFNFTESQ